MIQRDKIAKGLAYGLAIRLGIDVTDEIQDLRAELTPEEIEEHSFWIAWRVASQMRIDRTDP